MNTCFIIGKIVSEVQFDFYFNSKVHQSRVLLEIVPLKSNDKIVARAYDEKADIIYQNYKKGDCIAFEGKIRNEYLEVNEIEKSKNIL